jgi:hypothetical protein
MLEDHHVDRSERLTPHMAGESCGFDCGDGNTLVLRTRKAHGGKGQQGGCSLPGLSEADVQMCGMCKFFVGGGMMSHGMMGCGMGGDDDMPDAEVIHAGMMGGGMMRHGMMGGDCQVVEGRVSRMGWCDLYAPREDER